MKIIRLYIRAIWNGFVQWACEAGIGLIPLGAYLLGHASDDGHITALCAKSVLQQPSGSFGYNCTQYPDSPLLEICVLSVVISGLAVLSIAQYSPSRRQSPRTSLTLLMLALAIGSGGAGGIFYGQITAHLTVRADWVYANLVVALLSSFVLAIQEATYRSRGEEIA